MLLELLKGRLIYSNLELCDNLVEHIALRVAASLMQELLQVLLHCIGFLLASKLNNCMLYDLGLDVSLPLPVKLTKVI